MIVPKFENTISKDCSPKTLTYFFANFTQLSATIAADSKRSEKPSSFMYGRPPTEEDYFHDRDILRKSTTNIVTHAKNMLRNLGSTSPRLLLILGDAGSGKTTTLGRIAHDLVLTGHSVFHHNDHSPLDGRAVSELLEHVLRPVVLVVDGLAANGDVVANLLAQPSIFSKFIVLGAERSYRLAHLDRVLDGTKRIEHSLELPTFEEFVQLIERYRLAGLTGMKEANLDPNSFAKKLDNDPFAVAVCRIMNDFRPLQAILESLWNDTKSEHRYPLLCVALASYCSSNGIRYSLLQASGTGISSLGLLLGNTAPLGISISNEDSDFVVPTNATLLERCLFRARDKGDKLLYSVFVGLAQSLAPYVNRNAIKQRTAEARLAGRLFDADTVVLPLLDLEAERFYEDCHESWQWNSRYWEQRALLAAVRDDIDLAVRYARHAVSIEQHPFPFTTLGKLLMRSANEHSGPEARQRFNEAFSYLVKAIEFENHTFRSNPHSYSVLISGAATYLERGEKISGTQRRSIEKYCREVFQMSSANQALFSNAESLIEKLRVK